MVQLSDSTAIIILATIAGVYFSVTAACSVVICRIWCKKRRCSSKQSLEFPDSTPNDYELTHLKEVKAIRDHSDLVAGDRAKKWRQYMSSQPLRSNGTSPLNGTHYGQERPKLPAIEEVGEGVSVWSGEEESSVGGRRRKEVEGMGNGDVEENSVAESAMRNQWLAKRKVRGRTSSTKLLLEETDGSSSWTLTSTNDANGSMLDDMMSSLTLTASLPGSAIAQCGRSDTSYTIPIPRPLPKNTNIPINTHSVSLVSSTNNGADTGTASGHQLTSHVARSESDRASHSPENAKEPVCRSRKQHSISTRSLPRHSSSSIHPHKLEKQLSCTEGSGTFPQPGVNGGSRPKLRRYASTAPYSSSPSLGPIVLVKPRSRSRKNSYQSNTLGRSSFPENHSSMTSIEMERNYYTLQTKRGAVEEGEGRRDKESSMELEVSVGREERLAEGEISIQGNTNQKHIIRMDKNTHAPIIDLGHDGQDCSDV